MRSSTILGLALAGLMLASAGVASARDSGGSVYTLSNQTDDNRVLAYARKADGSLRPAGSFSAGGKGTGGGLGNQGAVVVSPNGRWLFAVNAGSDEISLFSVQRYGLRLVDRVASGGKRPVSLTLHDGVLYVVNAGGAVGGADNIAGFRVQPRGRLVPIAGSARALSRASTGPAQISFSPEGDFVVVTEKATNLILSFPVDPYGVAGAPIVNASVGQTPFGFAFDRQGALLVSEAFGGAADASALSSYDLGEDGSLDIVAPSVGTTETAACWVVTSRNGRYAYVTNTGSGTVSGYRVGEDGELELLDSDGITANTGVGSGPIDADVTRRGRFLYVLAGGSQTIQGFQIERDGSLTPIGTTPGLPVGANGLAAQ